LCNNEKVNIWGEATPGDGVGVLCTKLAGVEYYKKRDVNVNWSNFLRPISNIQYQNTMREVNLQRVTARK